jgi:hypothetical protein
MWSCSKWPWEISRSTDTSLLSLLFPVKLPSCVWLLLLFSEDFQGYPDTLTSVSILGLVLSREGKYEEAEAIRQRRP